MFEKMLRESRDDIWDSYLRKEMPEASDGQIAEESQSSDFGGFKTRLNRSWWEKVRDSAGMTVALGLLPAVIASATGTVCLLAGMENGAGVSFTAAAVFFMASPLVVLVRDKARERREVRFSYVGASLYRSFLRHAARFEEYSDDKVAASEILRLLGDFQDRVADEKGLSDALRSIMRANGLAEDLSAKDQRSESRYLSGAAREKFDRLEGNRSEVVGEMIRILKVIESLAVVAEEKAQDAQLDLPEGEDPVADDHLPLRKVETADTEYLEQYAKAVEAQVRLRELSEEKSLTSKTRLRA